MNPNSAPPTDEFPPVAEDDTQPVPVPARGPQPPTPPQTSFEPTYAELKASLADAQTEAQLLRDLLKEKSAQFERARLVNRAQSQMIRDLMDDAAPLLEHRILRQWVDSPAEREQAQLALSLLRNDGWRVLDFSVLAAPGDRTCALQVVTFEREVKPAPLTPLQADTATVVEDSVENEEFAQAMAERIILRSDPLFGYRVDIGES